MYGRKRVEARMGFWGTPAFMRYSQKEVSCRTTGTCLLLGYEKAKLLIWNSIRLDLLKKTILPNPVQTLSYIKCYCSSSPKPVIYYHNYIRYNYQQIYSWTRWPETIQEIRYKTTFFKVIKPLVCKFLKNFTNNKTKTYLALVFSHKPLHNILNTGSRDDNCQVKNKISSYTKRSGNMYVMIFIREINVSNNHQPVTKFRSRNNSM